MLITWLPEEKRKGKPALRLYDLDNRLLGETENKKNITVTPQKLSYSVWHVDFGTLPAGVYRIDVGLGSDVVWRMFFEWLNSFSASFF